MNPKVDWFINKATQWQEEYDKLRTIILDCGLTEELKWCVPCYTYGKSNVVLELKNTCSPFSKERDLMINETSIVKVG